jgi:MoxR-like ATPase
MEQFDLAAFIPDKFFYKRYIARDLGGGISDIEMLERAVRSGFNSLLMGPTGPGKTSLYLAVCAKNDWPLGTANLNGQTTVEDLVGQIIPVPADPSHLQALRELVVRARTEAEGIRLRGEPVDKLLEAKERFWRAELSLEAATSQGSGLMWVDGLLVRLMKGDPRFEHTVFLADEVNFAPAKVMAILNGVTDDRRQIAIVQHQGEIVQAHEGFHFGAAMNPFYEGTRSLNKAFKDRFTVQLVFDYDPVVEAQLINEPRLMEFVKKLRVSYAEGELHTPTSTRAMLQYQKLEQVMGTALARKCFISHYDEDEQEAVKDTMELHSARAREVPRIPSAS